MHFIGVKPFALWAGYFICDFCLFLIPAIAYIIMLPILGVNALSANWAAILAISTMFGFALIPMTYFFSFLFKNS